jgi:muramoyltetrapeptide carboxypeptidase
VPTLRKTRVLRPGDTIGIAAPAGPVNVERLEAGLALVRQLGFEPFHRPDITERRGYLAGEDSRRAGELMELVRDPKVSAILCARGGYGCHRIVSMLDATAVRKAAKPLVGYSDITTLLLWQRRCAGLMGIHGPMLEKETPAPGAHSALTRALMGVGSPPSLEGRPLAGGWREGRLTGGSLSVVVASLGTPWEIDTRDAILMIEDVNEPPYRLDRMLQQLRAAGKLDSVVGVGVGSMLGCENGDDLSIGVGDVLEEILVPLGVPVVSELPFGHGAENLPWPHGGRAAIDGDRGEIELLEFSVAKR